MEEIKKEGWVIGAFALIFAVLNRITQNAEINRIFIFNEPNMYWKYYVMTAVALVVSFFLFAFLIWIVFELGRWHHKTCMGFIRYFLVYFAIQLMILLLIWPGNFKQDEIYLTVFAVINMEVCWYQSFFTQLLYITAFMIFPYIASVTFFQILIVSLLAAGVMQKTENILKNRKYVWLLMLPFLLFPILDSNQFSLRSSLICWVLSMIFVTEWLDLKASNKIGEKV